MLCWLIQHCCNQNIHFYHYNVDPRIILLILSFAEIQICLYIWKEYFQEQHIEELGTFLKEILNNHFLSLTNLFA